MLQIFTNSHSDDLLLTVYLRSVARTDKEQMIAKQTDNKHKL